MSGLEMMYSIWKPYSFNASGGFRGLLRAFASAPLSYVSCKTGEGKAGSKLFEIQVVEIETIASSLKVQVPDTMQIDVSSLAGNFVSTSSSPCTTTRKGEILILDRTLKCLIMQMMRMGIKKVFKKRFFLP